VNRKPGVPDIQFLAHDVVILKVRLSVVNASCLIGRCERSHDGFPDVLQTDRDHQPKIDLLVQASR